MRSIGKLVDSSFNHPKTKKKHRRYHIQLDADFVETEKFPFKPGDNLLISIEGNKLEVEKV